MKIKDFNTIKKIVGDFNIIDIIPDVIPDVMFEFKEDLDIEKLKVFYEWCYDNVPMCYGIITNKDNLLTYSHYLKLELEKYKNDT